MTTTKAETRRKIYISQQEIEGQINKAPELPDALRWSKSPTPYATFTEYAFKGSVLQVKKLMFRTFLLKGIIF